MHLQKTPQAGTFCTLELGNVIQSEKIDEKLDLKGPYFVFFDAVNETGLP